MDEGRAGAGDALAAAFEIVATPAVFAAGGWLLDGRLGTFPLVTVAAALVVLCYQMWRLARQYGRQLDAALQSRRASYPSPEPEPSTRPRSAVSP